MSKISAMGFNNYIKFLGFTVFISSICLFPASSVDFIASSKFIKDPDTLSSGDFKLGFFSPVNSTNRYVGIWYLSESNVIWVANRNKPLRDSSGLVTLSDDGNLVVLNGQNLTLWSSDVPNITPSPTTIALAQLLDTGNLILKVIDNTTGMISMTTVWESFQYPCDSWLPKMKVGFNPRTGKKTKITSWRSPSDPSIGTFSVSIERLDPPELFTMNGSRPYGRTGPWKRHLFFRIDATIRASSSYADFGMSTVQNEQDGTISLKFDLLNKYEFAVLKLDSTGKWFLSVWRHQKVIWLWRSKNGEDECEIYGRCGKFGICDSNSSPICTCLSGFEPRNIEEWNRNNWTSGCVRKAPLQCERLKNGGEDGFQKVHMVKMPDFVERSNVQEDKCRTQCLQNCSCVAYAYDLTIGCMSWSVDLIDIMKLNSTSDVDLNIRLSNSEIADKNEKKRKAKDKAKSILIRVTIGTVGTITVAGCAYIFWTWAAKHADPKKVIMLDWHRRFNIIEGVARGLLYLHRDSRLKIIHRDLKAANILLDEELNPKISDFGLAKIFATSEDEANTRRIVGTYGYMAPEYAMEGLVSEKSDVFSFGVLLLEIVSGKRNSGFYNDELSLSLLGFVWKLWNEENIISLIESDIDESRFRVDILRCIHIGLLCVQEFARDRPIMATVISMLNSAIVDLPPPKEPAYTRRQAISSAESFQNRN